VASKRYKLFNDTPEYIVYFTNAFLQFGATTGVLRPEGKFNSDDPFTAEQMVNSGRHAETELTALHFAAFNDLPNIVPALLDKGADPDADGWIFDINGRMIVGAHTPADVAIMQGSLETLKALEARSKRKTRVHSAETRKTLLSAYSTLCKGTLGELSKGDSTAARVERVTK
jgi:hypothetical protein